MTQNPNTWVFSASQLKTWQACQRKWAWSAIHKIREANKYAQRGTECHARIEAWLKEGVAPGEDHYGKVVRAGLKHLPPPRTARIEREFTLVSDGGISYRGFIDVDYFDPKLSRPVIFDHKTTTDFKWALSVDDLKDDIQGLIYANEALRFHGADLVDLRWVYYRDTPKSPAAKVVSATVDKAEAKRKLNLIDQTAFEIKAIGLRASHALELTANPLACSQYGGCPHRDRCGLTDEERLGAIMEQSSIREKLLRNTNGQTKAHEADKVQTPASAPSEAGAPSPSDVKSRLLGARAASPAATAPAATTPAAATPAVTAPATGSVRSKLLGGGTVAPAESAVKAAVDEMRAIHAETQVDKVSTVAAGQINPPEQPTEPLKTAEEVQGLVQAKKDAEKAEKDARKPGRPKGAVNFRPVTDEGHIFSAVFCEVLRSGGAHDLASDIATLAVKAFKKID